MISAAVVVVVASSCEPFHAVDSTRFGWIRKVFVWPHLDSKVQILEVVDMDAEGVVLPVVAFADKAPVLALDMDSVEYHKVASNVHVDPVYHRVAERIDCQWDSVDLLGHQQLGSWPTCRHLFSYRNPEVLPD